MTRIKDTFDQLQAQGKKGLIVYLTAGYPDYETTREAVLAAAASGADIIELGLPFSDPMADGPVIQEAAQRALNAGATTAKALQLVRDLRQETQTPLLAMAYVNTLLQYGVSSFIADFKAAGLDGVIIPDLPSEEAALVTPYCGDGFDNISFIAPTTTPDRLAAVGAGASGFIYCISNTGVTGVRRVDYRPIGELVAAARRHTSLPLAIGFGIGDAASARDAAEYADAVIVGSAVVKELGTNGIPGIKALIAALRRSLDGEE